MAAGAVGNGAGVVAGAGCAVGFSVGSVSGCAGDVAWDSAAVSPLVATGLAAAGLPVARNAARLLGSPYYRRFPRQAESA